MLVAVLKGAVVFLADLMRAIEAPCECDFIAVSSYGASTRSSGIVRLTKDLSVSIEGRDVLIVEDIVDTGLTLSYLLRNLETRQPRSLRVCALLDKATRREVPVPLDYVGFTIPDEFVVGYGLDYAGLYRNLRHVAVLEGVAS
jgi:hypoxanthine phosphoribosyltransferase